MATFAGPAVFPTFFVNARGEPLPGLSITVYERGTTTKAKLYTDRTKVTIATNPFLTDEVGNAFPFLAPGAYDAVVNGVVIPFSVTPDAADVADLFGGVWYEI